MKYCMLLLLWATMGLGLQAQHFEGIIEMRQETADGLSYTLKWYIKGERLAYEMTDQQERIRFVPRPASGAMLMVTGETKTTIPVSDITGVAAQQLQGAALQNNGNGRCPHFNQVEQWRIATTDVEAILEVTTDVHVNFGHYREFFKNDYTLYALATSGKVGFPLNSIARDQHGNVLSRTTITKVTRTTLPDSYFE